MLFSELYKIMVNKAIFLGFRGVIGRPTTTLKFFPPSGKMCWTQFKNIGQSSKNLCPSRKTFAPPGMPSWLRGDPPPGSAPDLRSATQCRPREVTFAVDSSIELRRCLYDCSSTNHFVKGRAWFLAVTFSQLDDLPTVVKVVANIIRSVAPWLSWSCCYMDTTMTIILLKKLQ